MVYENYRKNKSKELKCKYERWRLISKQLKLSREAKNRLEWMIYHQTKAKGNVALVCRYYGIGKSTFYKWYNLFNETNLRSLENRSRKPKHVCSRQAEPAKDERVIKLRKKYIYFGKMKIKVLYENEFKEKITSWYIQRVIEEYNLYPKKRRKKKTKKQKSKIKKRITEFKVKPRTTGFLLHLDTIVLHLQGVKRYVITAIDDHSRLAYARVYKSHSSACTKDFFNKLYYLLDEKIENVHTDNGSEFHKHFETGLQKLNLTHWWSRVRNPKDNAQNERFNRTFREEFLKQGNFHKNIDVFNNKITDWLVEYNSVRPHQSLNYLTPLHFAQISRNLSTMWSSHTHY
jgi:putative transposase